MPGILSQSNISLRGAMYEYDVKSRNLPQKKMALVMVCSVLLLWSMTRPLSLVRSLLVRLARYVRYRCELRLRPRCRLRLPRAIGYSLGAPWALGTESALSVRTWLPGTLSSQVVCIASYTCRGAAGIISAPLRPVRVPPNPREAPRSAAPAAEGKVYSRVRSSHSCHTCTFSHTQCQCLSEGWSDRNRAS